ncbi:hypothetical protein A2999_02660 [Candidatus Wolfebacteria bacterium RIFCSPLOWO2_01_FULL_38_11]|uniref:Uncharacterized protein n=1 Tax=Candidatus Wolfebacteria bacterium RIFCSPLOWO2_01_FULL_38_11 TaxID=1802556 RepID=A0A1F8DRZ1_9BACT|nr:MAG: hypothetical protein A2999_02660 [Candidatus Wolfebacteria bacterium RIFCSPLOWO2_01_FULL_38_11]
MVFLLKNKLWQKHLLLQEQIKNKNIPLVLSAGVLNAGEKGDILEILAFAGSVLEKWPAAEKSPA